MKRLFRLIVLFCFVMSLCSAAGEAAHSAGTAGYVPKKNRELQELRLGCLYSGETDYHMTELLSFGEELGRQQLMYGFGREWDWSGIEEVWEDFTYCISYNLHFEPERIYDCSVLSGKERQEILDAEEIDLWLAFGDAAGKFLSEEDEKLSADALLFGCTDAAAEEKKLRHTYQMHYEEGSDRQIDAAWKILQFPSLGVVLRGDEEKSLSWYQAAEKAAKKCGYTLRSFYVKEPYGTEKLKEAYKAAFTASDIVLVTEDLPSDALSALLKGAAKNHTATLSLVSEEQAENGVLMFVGTRNPDAEGVFAAQTLKRYAEGTKIPELPRNFQVTPQIILNKETAEKAGIKIPMETWLMADKIYGGNEG